ncbi:hypothetical protein D1B31_18120 [Neobacillus notoginsengisoli]|uniref:Uncharacterized protein n=1 Tax=Neobacillus notoginsengisoli TaxID=1578198 RepID=A0A417YPT7_9BACI|nr:hypothetical protein [Neobacillus notoginsengisoli]RHW36005.1 hypothetical protein D1B31_18120 [Neobacillus notoginsengisoli]
MKKSYSKWNLLQEQLAGFVDNRGLLKFLMTNRKYVTVKIPYYDYIRGKVFIEDLRDNFKDEVPIQFDFSLLLYMLYDDFLNQIKRGAKNQQIADYLIAGTKSYFQKKKKKKRVMKPISKTLIEFETIEEEEYDEEEGQTAFLDLRMKESEILRAEVLIHDLQPYFKGQIEVSIEDVITIVYLDFIQNIKKEGNSIKVQQSIIAHLKRF